MQHGTTPTTNSGAPSRDKPPARAVPSTTALPTTAETNSPPPPWAPPPYGYSYDNIGNRKTAQEPAQELAYAANELNQYTAIRQGSGEEGESTESEADTFTPTYDADGNQTRIKTATGIWNVTYNAENRPIRFESADGATVIDCTYDYMGRRHTHKVTVNGAVSNYLRYIYRGYLQIAAIDAVSGVFRWFLFWDPTQPTATRPLAIRKDSTWYAYG